MDPAAFAQEFTTFLIVLARTIGLIVSSPLIKYSFLPARIGVYLSLAISAVIYSTMDNSTSIPNLETLFFLCFTEFLFGLTVGLISLITIEAFNYAGQIIANAIGLGFSLLLNPSTGTQSSVLSSIYSLAGITFLLIMGCHLFLINTLNISYEIFPMGQTNIAFTIDALGEFLSKLLRIAVTFTLPLLFPLLLINLTFGMITKAAPALNIFSIGFPSVLVIGLFILSLTTYTFGDFATKVGLTLQEFITAGFYV